MMCPNPNCRNGWVLTDGVVECAPDEYGFIRYSIPRDLPCPDCLGGAAYCCDGGDRADPEDEPSRSEKAY